MVIIVDDEDRENEGDLFVAAERATPEAINFMAAHGRGLVSLALTEERMRELGLSLITDDTGNQTRFGTAFATPDRRARRRELRHVGARPRAHHRGRDRGRRPGPADLIRPGRLQTLRAVDGGVLARRGHTEAAVDLARLAGLKPAGVICEIMKDDGTMARMPDLERFAREHDLKHPEDRRSDRLSPATSARSGAGRKPCCRRARRGLPADGLQRQPRDAGVRRAGQGRDASPTRRRWCGCIRSA